ncbi:MAG: transglycosylase SLT domain-containing protein [Acidobacteria bacterium]|nr:transglycosylase SLT domain-containing protein [Acidobacteriota bacterium]
MAHIDQLDEELVAPRRLALIRESSWTSPLVLIFLTLSVLILAAAGSAVYFSWQTQQQVRKQTGQFAYLEGQTRAVNQEIVDLRHYVASKTSEDVLYLKMCMLKPDLDPVQSANIARLVHRYAGMYNQDADLILAIMYIESGFDPNAVSSKGATGLMQVMPQWQKVLAMSGDLKDPETSLKYGLQIYAFYKEMYKDDEMALTAYNRGPGPIDMALMNGKDYKNGYSAKIMEVYQRLKDMSAQAK